MKNHNFEKSINKVKKGKSELFLGNPNKITKINIFIENNPLNY